MYCILCIFYTLNYFKFHNNIMINSEQHIDILKPIITFCVNLTVGKHSIL